MSAECSTCGHDMGYGPMGVPVCGWCELRAERDDLARRLEEAEEYIQRLSRFESAYWKAYPWISVSPSLNENASLPSVDELDP